MNTMLNLDPALFVTIDDTISPAVEVLVSEPNLHFQCVGVSAPKTHRVQWHSRRAGVRREHTRIEKRPCEAKTVWEIDGQFYCPRHAEEYWKSHYVDEHKVTRLYDEDLQEALESLHAIRATRAQAQARGLHRIK